MTLRYLDSGKVNLPASAPQFVEVGHCLWCNKPLTGKATKYCVPTKDDLLWGDGRRFSLCYIYFNNWWYQRPAYQRAALIRDNFTCQKCGLHHMREDKPWLPDLSRLHVDHIVPISVVGYTEMENLQTLCDKCNLKKGAKVPAGEEPPGIPSYKIRRDGYPPGKCPECRNEAYLLIDWTPPPGIDERMRKVVCRHCEVTYYLAPIIKISLGKRRKHETVQKNHREN